MGGAGGFAADQRRRRGGKARVAGLPDLDRAVVDELGGEEAGAGGEDHGADRPFRGEDRARPRCDPDRQVAGRQQAPFEHRERSQEEHPDRPQPTSQPARPPLRGGGDPAGEARERRPDPHHEAIDAAIEPRRRPSHPGPRRARQRPRTAPLRCYHRPSLRLLFRWTIRRAREGLFHAPTPALAGRLSFSLPASRRPLTLRPWHAASPSRKRATSGSWRTSTPVRRRRPSASSTTPAAPTKWARSTRARPSWTGWSRSRNGGSRSPRRPPHATGRATGSTSSTRPDMSTSRSRSSAASASSTALSPSSTPSPASSRSRRPSGARPTSTGSRGSPTSTRWTAPGQTSSTRSRR